jgi:glycosyltransferase involved in cell wall biosynthesis
MNKKLGVFGPYPPPLGGISVHIERMEYFLQKENIDYTIYNHGFSKGNNVITTNKKWYWYIKMLFLKSHNTFHFHQFFLFHFTYFFIFSLLRKEKIIVTIHSERILFYHKILRSVVLFFIKKTKRLTLICVSQNLSNYFNKAGIKCATLPAYVPPKLVKDCNVNSSKKLILFSVWKFNEKLANEIYNVPLAFEYLSRNKKDYEMLFMVGNRLGSDEKLLDKLISKYDIRDNLKVIYDESLINYVKNCHLLLRPNLSDGYGVSLQEALDLGVPGIASDVCERPKGTILFKNNNIEDLSSKMKLVDTIPLTEILKEKEELNYHLKLIEIYKTCIYE